MKRIISAVIAVWLAVTAIGTANMHPRVAALKLAPVPHQMMFIGDSITKGDLVLAGDTLPARTAIALWGVKSASAEGWTLINKGVNGMSLVSGTEPHLADAWPGYLATLNAGDIAIINIGMNDLVGYAGDVPWTSAYITMVNAFVAKGVNLQISTITPVATSQWPREVLRENLNGFIVGYFGAPSVLDFSVLLRNPQGQTWIDPDDVQPDGFHLKAMGYVRMADLIAARLTSYGWVVP